jgi:hypothetical protein
MQLSKGAMIGIVIAAVLVIGGLGWFLFLRPGGGALSSSQQAQRDAAMKAMQERAPGMTQRSRPGGMGSGTVGGYPTGRPGMPGMPGSGMPGSGMPGSGMPGSGMPGSAMPPGR